MTSPAPWRTGHGDHIETVDGGVGDDKEASILKAGGDTHSLAATICWRWRTSTSLRSIPVSSLPRYWRSSQADLLGLLPTCSARRFAWLQCFLF